MKPDNVNHPPHYNSSPAHCDCGRRIECIDITRHMHFNLGNAMKYVWRFRDKGGKEDLMKALWYIQDHINHIEAIEEGFLQKEQTNAKR